jgi:hypothetical protein
MQTRRNLMLTIFAAVVAALGQTSIEPSDIVGHWTWYHRTDNARGRFAAGTSREIWIFANGQFKYSSTVYIPNMPPSIDPTRTITGTYRLRGNMIFARSDNGEQATYTLELVNGGKGIRVNGELYIRD